MLDITSQTLTELIKNIKEKKISSEETTNAFIAAALAVSLLNQKPIKKYEQSPTPSQPKNSCRKLSAVTKVNIANVKSDK